MVTCTTGVGTPAFMAPEIIIGVPETSPQAAPTNGGGAPHPATQPSSDFASPTDVFAYGMLLVSMWNCLAPRQDRAI